MDDKELKEVIEAFHIVTGIPQPEEKIVSPFKQRFSDAPWFDLLKDTYVLLLGAGGIGSWVGLALTRAGVDFTVFDMDTVEVHNLGGQLFTNSGIGKLKTQALKEVCEILSGKENLIRTEGKYTEDSYTNNIVIAAFDNMAGRKLAFEKWKALVQSYLKDGLTGEADQCLFIDGRLLAEDYQVYAVTKDTIEEYESTLFADTELEEVMCTLKSTSHCSMAIASEIMFVLSNFITNVSWGMNGREVPFRIIKSAPLYSYSSVNKEEYGRELSNR